LNPTEEEKAAAITPAYRSYALSLFLLVYIINFVDRQIFGILIEPIRLEIDLSDTQLGLLGGIAFAIFYTFAGIPIARWADVGVRKNIVALALVIWSVMTMFTSTAKGFGTLLIARVGVGIGEAGCSPPIHSLISDMYPEEERATALSTYALGIPIGAAIGTLLGGWIGEYFGWRMAFMVVGLPGIIVAIVVFFTVREPPRGHSEPDHVQVQKDLVPLADTLRFLWSLRAFRHLSFAGALHAFVGYGVGLFIPAFFMRVHGFGLAETSTYLFLIGLTGIIGTYLGGYLGDRMGKKDKRWYMGIPGIATIISVPFAVLFYTTGDPMLAIVLAIPGAILGPMYLGPTFAMTQTLVPPAMRSTASAILLFVLNLIGLGLGPVFAGFLSDILRPGYGEESIRYSLLILAVAGNIWSALHYYLASRTLREDLVAKDQLAEESLASE
jgi:predicted MFS family arabinose efflux permease|tara:strand:- start:2432 stop:3754 length:1323 start_codon:yes stop_codon:yes gene_type:complete